MVLDISYCGSLIYIYQLLCYAIIYIMYIFLYITDFLSTQNKGNENIFQSAVMPPNCFKMLLDI